MANGGASRSTEPITYVRTVAEPGQWFPLAELEPDGPLVLAA
jgi:hypothetical protein